MVAIARTRNGDSTTEGVARSTRHGNGIAAMADTEATTAGDTYTADTTTATGDGARDLAISALRAGEADSTAALLIEELALLMMKDLKPWTPAYWPLPDTPT